MKNPLRSNMDTKIKAQWLAALRSGEYKQGKRFLHNKDHEFCCLGVLLDATGTNWHFVRGEDCCEDCYISDVGKTYMDVTANGYLKPEELEKFNITKDDMRYLVEMNDEKQYKFDQIADWIEEVM